MTLRLDENPTTGYRWNVETAEGLEIVGDSFERAGDAIGAAGVRVFQFLHRKLGLTGLTLENGVIGKEKVR